MKVTARCTARAWDSEAAVLLYPGGGPLPNGDYEIERDGKLASLKVGKDYVFAFDRNAPSGQTNDYTCEQCGEKCKALNELGTHVHSKHSEGAEAAPEEEEVFADRTCPECKKVCRSPYGLKVHQRKAHGVEADNAKAA